MDPVAFTVFGIEVRWYGILIAVGMLLGIFITYKRAPRFGIDSERIVDVGLFCIPAAIIGARFWYVAFNWDMYQGDIMKVLNIRQGGLAFHGGLIFAVITAVLLCRKWSVNPWNLTDLAMPAVALGQAIGRWGNYINQEAYGVANLGDVVFLDLAEVLGKVNGGGGDGVAVVVVVGAQGAAAAYAVAGKGEHHAVDMVDAEQVGADGGAVAGSRGAFSLAVVDVEVHLAVDGGGAVFEQVGFAVDNLGEAPRGIAYVDSLAGR